MGRFLLVAVLLAGCRATGAFVCATDDQCRHAGALGRCEPVGYCSFTDGMCPSGSRYDDNSGPGYGGQCVESSTMIDAAIDSPPPFNPALCPAQYVQINATRTTTRYRLVTPQGTFLQHATNCNDDLVGATHLATPQTAQELDDLSQWIDPMPNTGAQFWLGVVQDPNALLPDARWILLDDTNVPLDLWKPGDPNDSDGDENRQEQFAYFDKSPINRRMTDTPGNTGHGGVCECDGVPIGPSATVFVQQ